MLNEISMNLSKLKSLESRALTSLEPTEATVRELRQRLETLKVGAERRLSDLESALALQEQFSDQSQALSTLIGAASCTNYPDNTFSSLEDLHAYTEV